MSNTVNRPAALSAEIEAFDAGIMWRPVVDGYIEMTAAEVKQFKMLGVKVAKALGADMTVQRVQDIMWAHLKSCFDGCLDTTSPDRLFRAETSPAELLTKMAAKLAFHQHQFTTEQVAAGRAAIEAFDAGVRDGDFDAQRGAIEDFRAAATGDRERYLFSLGEELHRQLAARDDEVPLFGQKFERVIEAAGIRMKVEYRGIATLALVSYRAVDGGPFISESGFKSLSAGDAFGIIDAGGLEPLRYFAAIAEQSVLDKKTGKFALVPVDKDWLRGRCAGRAAA